jgi:NAD+ kinase
MTLGIIANTKKENVFDIITGLIKKLSSKGLNYLLDKPLYNQRSSLDAKVSKAKFAATDTLCKRSDIIISIGGDGTMLATAFHAHKFDKPVLGVNFGKLGFLVEVNINQMDQFIEEILTGNYIIDERMVIEGKCLNHKVEKLYGINDIVIEKGGWPKMIELSLTVDDEYVTTFAADGLIISTPTGSTGYSISSGGPIVSPKADVITLSPISPHSLTVRPIVLPGSQKIIVEASSLHSSVQVSCDGQRVFLFPPPLKIKITKSERPLKLVHTSLTTYFETLRNKLMWGIDLRKNFLDK